MLSEMEASRGFEQKRTSADWCRARMEEGAHLAVGAYGQEMVVNLAAGLGILYFCLKTKEEYIQTTPKKCFSPST